LPRAAGGEIAGGFCVGELWHRHATLHKPGGMSAPTCARCKAFFKHAAGVVIFKNYKATNIFGTLLHIHTVGADMQRGFCSQACLCQHFQPLQPGVSVPAPSTIAAPRFRASIPNPPARTFITYTYIRS